MSNRIKMTPREWIENYWYHYKWPTLVGLFFVFVFLVGIVQCATRVDGDVIVMYSGSKSLSLDSMHLMESTLAEVMEEDYNEDGVKYVQYLENVVIVDDFTGVDQNGNEQVLIDKTEQIESYVTQVAAGDAQIYLLSPDVYDELSKHGVLVSLDEIYGKVPVEAHDSCSYQLSKLDAYSLPGLRELPEDTLICLRRAKTLGVFDAAEAEEEHRYAKELFCSLIEYKA